MPYRGYNWMFEGLIHEVDKLTPGLKLLFLVYVIFSYLTISIELCYELKRTPLDKNLRFILILILIIFMYFGFGPSPFFFWCRWRRYFLTHPATDADRVWFWFLLQIVFACYGYFMWKAHKDKGLQEDLQNFKHEWPEKLYWLLTAFMLIVRVKYNSL